MNETYIDIKRIAEIKGLKSTRSIRIAIQKGKYIAREVKVNGGTSYEILYSSLEPEIQERIFGRAMSSDSEQARKVSVGRYSADTPNNPRQKGTKMNILKLARHLKEFTLDEIEIIADCDCKTELEHLLNEGKIVFEQGLYKYKEPEQLKTFDIFEKPIYKSCERVLFKDMAIIYLNNRRLTKDTLKGYRSQLKYNIIPFFEGLYVDEITYEMILEFVDFMKKKFKPKTASNGVTLLGSILKYAFMEGYIKNNPYFGVRNSMCK